VVITHVAPWTSEVCTEQVEDAHASCTQSQVPSHSWCIGNFPSFFLKYSTMAAFGCLPGAQWSEVFSVLSYLSSIIIWMCSHIGLFLSQGWGESLTH
jgi:hypothetical protein